MAERTTRALLFLLPVLAAAFLAAPAGAQQTLFQLGPERITEFHSDVRMRRDGSLIVTETIRVVAQGIRIRRGIYRDFPTRYRTEQGATKQVGFDVLDVKRDGRKEPWFTRARTNGVRVYIGDSDKTIPRGEHTYTLTYRTDRQLGFFDTFDELYWNVTGTGWAFIMDRVSATVHLPGSTRATKLTAYVGRAGQRLADWQSERRADGSVHFRTTRKLGPGETLTIVVQFPKGVVQPPSRWQRFRWFVRDNTGFVVALGGLVLLLVFYAIAWAAVGIDPRKGTIIPRFHPPKGFTPAACRFVSRMGFDNKCFAAALVSLAVKGFLTIEQDEKGKFTLHKRKGRALAKASRGEKKVFSALLSRSDEIVMEQANHSRFSKAQSGLKGALSDEYEAAHFRRNFWLFLIGMAISIAVAIPVLLMSPGESGLALGTLTIFGSAALMMGASLFGGWTHQNVGQRIGVLVGALILGGVSLGSIAIYLAEGSLLTLAAFVGIVAVNAAFFHLLKAPTFDGRRVMDEIDGLKMYMTVAERERLEAMHPPEQTPEEFERLLPFAVALDVENTWAKRFESILKAAQQRPGDGYQPYWYNTQHMTNFSVGALATSLGTSLAGSIAAASAAPGSASGGSSGGSAGGGGGGGGGGGW